MLSPDMHHSPVGPAPAPVPCELQGARVRTAARKRPLCALRAGSCSPGGPGPRAAVLHSP